METKMLNDSIMLKIIQVLQATAKTKNLTKLIWLEKKKDI